MKKSWIALSLSDPDRHDGLLLLYLAQQVTGTPGSPSATTTIDGKQLPPPDPKFGGVIKDDALAVEAVVGAARRAAEGRTERACSSSPTTPASACRAPSAA